MRALVTGGTGFIGRKLIEQLRLRGDEVAVTVRNRARSKSLVELGCEIVDLSLDDQGAFAKAATGADAVFHLAGRFEIGVPAAERDDMMRVNAEFTESVITAATNAGVPKIVYASTINAFGDTRGAVVDESFRREGKFLSLYDESKYRAHEIALQKAADGAPVVLVQPGVVYGPGDHFETGREILLAARGKLRLLMLGEIGVTMSFVDDVADGFLKAFDHGSTGQCYVLGGEITRLKDVLEASARLAGRSFRPLPVPTAALKAIAPLGPAIAPKLGYPPNLSELIRVSDGTTYWASSGRAERDLGYRPRPLEDGLKATLRAAGITG